MCKKKEKRKKTGENCTTKEGKDGGKGRERKGGNSANSRLKS